MRINSAEEELAVMAEYNIQITEKDLNAYLSES